MLRKWKILLLLGAALMLSGCTMSTVDKMYSLPKRSEAYSNLQSAIDKAMGDMEYAAPDSGENQQTVQQADLDGDGQEEYLLFARGSGEKPLHILIFNRMEDRYDLAASIASPGFSFEQVEYVNIDGRPGMEIVVGCRVSEQVMRNLTVYTFADGQLQQLMNANYTKFLTCNLDGDGSGEIMLLQPGETEGDNGIAVHYRYINGELERSREVNLSGPVTKVKRIMVSSLQSGEQAVYVAGVVSENTVITDVFALKKDEFTNISFSNESETSIQTLRNYYVFADDIDNDGVLELPSLITMVPLDQQKLSQQQYLIRWYGMDLAGVETDKCYTYHNFMGGWYLELNPELSDLITIQQNGQEYAFYLWNGTFTNATQLLQIYALTGPDREDEAIADGRFVLHRGDGVVYAAKLQEAAYGIAFSQEEIINRFHLIHHDWKTGET